MAQVQRRGRQNIRERTCRPDPRVLKKKMERSCGRPVEMVVVQVKGDGYRGERYVACKKKDIQVKNRSSFVVRLDMHSVSEWCDRPNK